MNKTGSTNDEDKFTLLDIVRILGGLLLLNALLSYWFTSSTMWGYEIPPKYIDPRYLKYQIIGTPLNLTMEELSLYNGTDYNLPIYVGINGNLYDVTSSRQIYGPRGTYHAFAGKDCARLFHNGCFHREDQLTFDLRGLNMVDALRDISSWQTYYETHKKYWYVGLVQHDDLIGDPPAACTGPKYPG